MLSPSLPLYQASNFRGRTRLEDKDYSLEADTLYYDNKNEIGYAWRNVKLYNRKDSLTSFGDVAWYRGKDGESKIYGKALAYQIQNKDTLWLKADTIYIVNRNNIVDSLKTKHLLAYDHVQIFKSDFQAKCDSLAYNQKDSTLRFFQNPVLWAKGSQLTADTIFSQMANNQIERLHLRLNSMMVNEDTLKNYNQIKGRNITAYFNNNRPKRVEVRSNAQSIYFAIDKDTLLVGMNKTECSDMNIAFNEKNQLQKITQINKVDGQFVPPHEVKPDNVKLNNFKWYDKEKPTRKLMKR